MADADAKQADVISSGIKELLQIVPGLLGGVRKAVNPPYGYDHTEDFCIYYINLLASNGLSKPFADGKSTGDSRFSGARGCSHLDGTK